MATIASRLAIGTAGVQLVNYAYQTINEKVSELRQRKVQYLIGSTLASSAVTYFTHLAGISWLGAFGIGALFFILASRISLSVTDIKRCQNSDLFKMMIRSIFENDLTSFRVLRPSLAVAGDAQDLLLEMIAKYSTVEFLKILCPNLVKFESNMDKTSLLKINELIGVAHQYYNFQFSQSFAKALKQLPEDDIYSVMKSVVLSNHYNVFSLVDLTQTALDQQQKIELLKLAKRYGRARIVFALKEAGQITDIDLGKLAAIVVLRGSVDGLKAIIALNRISIDKELLSQWDGRLRMRSEKEPMKSFLQTLASNIQ